VVILEETYTAQTYFSFYKAVTFDLWQLLYLKSLKAKSKFLYALIAIY